MLYVYIYSMYMYKFMCICIYIYIMYSNVFRCITYTTVHRSCMYRLDRLHFTYPTVVAAQVLSSGSQLFPNRVKSLSLAG